MNCARRCKKGFLLIEQHEGVTVMQCHWCKGVWLDRNDIDDIEDLAFSEKWLNKSFKVTDKDTTWLCHHCGYKLKGVEYFEKGVNVGFCPEGHGWWFDNPKKEKLEDFFEKREKALQKLMETKKIWKDYLRALKSGEFINHVSGVTPPWWDDTEENKVRPKKKKQKTINKKNGSRKGTVVKAEKNKGKGTSIKAVERKQGRPRDLKGKKKK